MLSPSRWVNFRFAFLVFVAVYVAIFAMSDAPHRCPVSANGLDYCLVTDINITNNGGAALTDQPVRVLIPAASMTGGDQMDSRAWDVFPILGTIADEIEVEPQSMSSSQAPFWFHIPSIAAGETRSVQMFTGSGENRRDGGITFTGGESITRSNNAALNITDNLEIEISLVNQDDTARTEWLYEYTTGAAGYGVFWFNNSSTLELAFMVDSSTCTLVWDSGWTDSVQEFTFEYIAAAGIDATIYRNGVSAATCDTDEGALGTHAEALVIGDNSSANAPLTGTTLLDVRVYEAGSKELHYGFDARRMTETNSTNPYQGTIDDYSANALTGNYTFDRDQTDLSFAVSVVAPNLYTPSLPSETGADIFGGAVIPGFATPVPTASSGLVRQFAIDPLQDVATATGAPSAGVIGVFAYAVSAILAFIVWKVTKGFMPAVVLTLGIGPTIAAVLGFIPQWSLILWGLSVLIIWFAQLRTQQES